MNAPAALADSGVAERTEPGDTPLEVGLMRLCGRDLAIPAANVREVVPLPEPLHPDFSGTGACAGSILIRGRAIPVLDIAQRLGFPPRPAGKGVVLILRHENALVGLIMDLVSGLARVTGDRVQPFSITGCEQRPVIHSSFPLGDTIVGLIDPAAMFALPGVAYTWEGRPAHAHRSGGPRSALVLVSIAGANIALDAALVVATVPSIQLKPSVAPNSKWTGMVRYLGREVPVVDDLTLFGLSGRAAEGTGGAVIVLQYDDRRMLGVKIDRVRRILSLDESAIQPLPSALGEQLSLFKGAVVDHEGLENLLLDGDALRRCEALRMIAALTRETGEPVPAHGLATRQPPQSGEFQSFVVFRTGSKRRAAALASVKQIIPFPQTFTAVRRPGSALQGIASFGGAPLPLIDLGIPPAGSSSEPGDRKVLVVETAGAFYGLVVDRLETIARAVSQRLPGPASNRQFIHARVNDRAVAVTLSDLAEEAERLTGTAHG